MKTAEIEKVLKMYRKQIKEALDPANGSIEERFLMINSIIRGEIKIRAHFYKQYEAAMKDLIKEQRKVKQGDHQLELAIAQFTGWSLGRTNPESLEELVLSMGLTKEEWAMIKKDKFVTETSWLSKDDIQTINDYFKQTNEKA